WWCRRSCWRGPPAGLSRRAQPASGYRRRWSPTWFGARRILYWQPRDQLLPSFKPDRRTPECVANGLDIPAQMTGKECLHHRSERETIFLANETVAFIAEGHVGDGSAALLQNIDDLLRFLRLHPDIVHPLADQQRAHDPLGARYRRARHQPCASFVGLRRGKATTEQCEPGLPIGRDRLHQGHQVRRPEHVDNASECLRCPGCGDKRSVTAIAAPAEADARRIGIALCYRPVGCVGQIILHLPAPLLVRSADERLAEPGRAAEID